MKTCIDCHTTFPLTAFVPKPSNKGGYEHRCRTCRSIKYNKSSPERTCRKIYLSQVHNSVNRGHALPAYTLEDFTTWVLNQPAFSMLYTAWEAAGYPKNLAPSVDRKNDSEGYTLSNIQLMTWAENRAKGHASKKSNTLIVNQRPVAAYNKDGSLHKRYLSMSEAMRDFGGVGAQSWGISTVCNGIPIKDGKGKLYTPRTYKGFVWHWDD